MLKRAPWAGAVEKLLSTPAAAAQPPAAAAAQAASGDITGTLVDQFDGVLPGVQVVLTQGDARVETRTNRSGDYAFHDVAPGGYLMTIALPGFRTVTRGVTVRSGEATDVSLTMVIGSLEETVTVVNDGTPPKVTGNPGRRPVPPLPPLAGPGGVRIGGNIKPPTKRVHVSPAYPASGGEGVVVLTTVIGEDGYVKNTTALSAPSEEMARAAIDAVNRWEFDPTLLDGRPIDTLMQVTVYFKNQ
jgi:TonB family protein